MTHHQEQEQTQRTPSTGESGPSEKQQGRSFVARILRYPIQTELWNLIVAAAVVGGLIAAVSTQVRHADEDARDRDAVREAERIYYDELDERRECLTAVERALDNRAQHVASADADEALLAEILPEAFGFGAETVAKLRAAAAKQRAILEAAPLLASDARSVAECPPEPVAPPSISVPTSTPGGTQR